MGIAIKDITAKSKLNYDKSKLFPELFKKKIL